MRNELVLIGPPTVGKTTVSKLLAEELGVPHVAMDLLLFSYFKEVGFDEAHWNLIGDKLGRPAAYRYLKVFGSYGVKRLLESHQNCLFDFGGGGVTGEFPDEWEAMQAALKDFRNVVFLIPTADKKESLEYLYVRNKFTPTGWTILEHIIFHHAHEELAKFTVYVKDKTPEQIRDEVLAVTGLARSGKGE